MNDMQALQRGYERENDSRDRRSPNERTWTFYQVGATREQMGRLVEEGWVVVYSQDRYQKRYRLSQKGRDMIWAEQMNKEFTKVPASSVMDAFALIVGFDDVKEAISRVVEVRHRINFLLEGPPACAKSLLLEGVRSVVEDSYIAFGSRTSAAGLSEKLFELRPTVLLLDEADKMDNECYSVLLGLMESGEILETKSRRSRGVVLPNTMVLGACNSSAKMPREFLSRFALHVHFPEYSRDEFIDVCHGFLSRGENCPAELAILIGKLVFDYALGDVRKARGVWQLMTEPTEQEVRRVVELMRKYSDNGVRHRNVHAKAQKSLL